MPLQTILTEWAIKRGLDAFVSVLFGFLNPFVKVIGFKATTDPVMIFYGSLEAVALVGTTESHPLPTRDVGNDPQVPLGSYQLPPDLSLITTEVAYRTQTGNTIRGPQKLIAECEAQVIGDIGMLLARSGRPGLRSVELQAGGYELRETYNRTTFAIGGPTSNVVTRQILSAEGARFSTDGSHILDRNGQRFAIDSSQPYDYAILKKSLNKWARSPDMPYFSFVMAGLGESGTRGAGRYFLTHIKSLKGRYGSNGFELVLKVNINDPQDITVVSFWEDKIELG
ncbi:MAG: hypothetical protein Q8P73_04065 [bacterium]|nr:hypothetical protein [bacterium]